jgi:MFS family permease
VIGPLGLRGAYWLHIAAAVVATLTLFFVEDAPRRDGIGRRALVIASMVGLGVAHVVLPFTTGAIGLAGAACFMGLGNGLSAGANMTVGADASPAVGRAAFLGAWRLLSDIGTGLGPLAVGSLTAIIALGPTSIVMGGVAGATAWTMGRWLPRGRVAAGQPTPSDPGASGP